MGKIRSKKGIEKSKEHKKSSDVKEKMEEGDQLNLYILVDFLQADRAKKYVCDGGQRVSDLSSPVPNRFIIEVCRYAPCHVRLCQSYIRKIEKKGSRGKFEIWPWKQNITRIYIVFVLNFAQCLNGRRANFGLL